MGRNNHIGTMELAALVRVTPKQIDTWAGLRYIKEEARPPGTGNKRRFKPAEVRIAQMMSVMVRAGVTPPIAARAARAAILEADSKGWLFMSELAPNVAITARITE